MLISIILPTYCPDDAVAKILQEFWKTLEETELPEEWDTQMVVIENGNPRTEWLKRASDIYIHKDKPIGYAKAVNIGLALADGDFIVIVNNDLKVQQDWLEKLINDYMATPEIGTLAPMGHPFPVTSHEGINFDQHWFSLVVMSRAVFTKIGYLDELLNYRFHDQDYSIRVRRAGLQVARTTSVIVDHINSATYSKMGRNEDPGERMLMMQRWGCATFEEWVKSTSLLKNN